MMAMRLEGAPALVVGGGEVAVGRVQLLLESGSQVVVIAPRVAPTILALAERGEVVVQTREVNPERDLDGHRVVFTAIDDEAVSADIARRCRARGTLVNVADVPELCDFFCVARGRRGNVQVAVSTNGRAPGLASRLRDSLLSSLPDNVVEGVEGFARLRNAIRQSDARPEASQRRMHWLRGVAQSLSWSELAALAHDNLGPYLQRYDEERGALLQPKLRAAKKRPRAKTAEPTVYLVGSGPGDPELLTRKAYDLLRSADLVLSDRLVAPAIRELIGGEVRIANKLAGRSERGQEQLCRWMLEGATAGRKVVRLKVGDPTIFGRACEEVHELLREGVRVEVVPGISSVLSAPVQAGIAPTVRGVADRILILTGQGQGGSVPHPPLWDASTTYIYLMAVSRFAEIAAQLEAQGFPLETPAACIERATQPDERVVSGSLASLPQRMAKLGVQAPATIIIGEVARQPEHHALLLARHAASAA